MNNLTIRIQNIALRSRQVVRVLYKYIIEPKSTNEDTRRREFIFNVIITTVFGIVFILNISVIHNQYTIPDYTGFNAGIFSLFTVFFGGLLFFSRKGYLNLATYLFIGIYYLGTTYGIYEWSIELPMGTLSYAVIIIMSSILISTRFGVYMTGIIMASFITIGFLQVKGIVIANTSWYADPIEFKDAFQHSLAYMSIMVVSWLANRDINISLMRARKSEKELKEERDQLEIKVENRTRDIKTIQLEKVSQLYRFAEFGRLASGIYHDLLNPLTAVSLSVEKLNEDIGDRSFETQNNIDKAIKASKRMDAFLQTVRKQLSAECAEELFSPAKEIQDAIDMLAHKTRVSHVEIYAHLDQEIKIYGVTTKFFQIVMNLISNALDAYRDTENKQREINITLATHINFVELIITDNGCGIPENITASIFDPFFTTKTEYSGIGLGLSNTKQIIEHDFKGSISVKSIEKT